jgi:hypothetical protein
MVDPFHLHAHDLGLGIVAALDGEHYVGVDAGGHEGTADAVVLLDVAVVTEGGRSVEEPKRPPPHPGNWSAAAMR